MTSLFVVAGVLISISVSIWWKAYHQPLSPWHIPKSTRTLRSVRWIYWILTQRYQLQVEGLDRVRAISTPILFLFEHVARTDALIHGCVLAATQSRIGSNNLVPKYLADSDFTQTPIVNKYLGELLIRVPEKSENDYRSQVKNLLDEAIGVLKSGKNVALSPTGKLIRKDGRTILGHKVGVTRILQGLKEGEVTVVSCTFEGLFGSVFSRAGSGELPSSGQVRKVLWAYLCGGLVFSRRRKVRLDFEVCELPLGSLATVSAVNEKLQKVFCDQREPWYVPYNCFEIINRYLARQRFDYHGMP